jgi:thermitase
MAEIPQFSGAPPERRTPEAVAEERAAVTVQINEWIKKLDEPEGIRPLLATGNAVLHERRAGLPLPQFTEDRDALVVTDRVVVPAAQVESARAAVRRARDMDGADDVEELHVPGLDDIRMLRFADIGRRRAQRLGFAALPAEELPGAPIHMVPMGGIRKAEGGPEMSGPAPEQDPWTRPASAPRGPRVTVIDTGIAAEQRADHWLRDLAGNGNVDELDVFAPHGRLDLSAGHGTFVTGVIQQVAPDADIEVVKVLDSDGLGDEVAIAEAIIDAAAGGTQIVNLSLGTVTADGEPPVVLQSALRAAIRARPDILFVCAAGNYGDERPCWPGAFSGIEEFRRHVVSVAALRLDGDAGSDFVGARWSSHGDWVTCSVPGQGVVSTYVEGEEMDQPPPLRKDKFGPGAWATWSGTSFAAPQLVGAIVWTMQQEGWAGTPWQACEKVLDQAEAVIPGYGRSIGILPV